MSCFFPPVLALLLCAAARGGLAADVNIRTVPTELNATGVIGVGCANLAGLEGAGGRASGWCHGRKALFASDRVCDCVRALYFQRKRLACEKVPETRALIQGSIVKACVDLRSRANKDWLRYCGSAPNPAECASGHNIFKTERCFCNGNPCYANLIPGSGLSNFCKQYRVFKWDPALDEP